MFINLYWIKILIKIINLLYIIKKLCQPPTPKFGVGVNVEK